jgi:C-terminal processing protease CtpA/Prc
VEVHQASPTSIDLRCSLTSIDRFVVGLGITIAGYVCEKEGLSGIFVKSISPGSAAALTGRINVNDQIIEVDGQSLTGYNNHRAVELLRSTGNRVILTLARYLRGPKYEQLQMAIANAQPAPQLTGYPDHPECAISPVVSALAF